MQGDTIWQKVFAPIAVHMVDGRGSLSRIWTTARAMVSIGIVDCPLDWAESAVMTYERMEKVGKTGDQERVL